jgi:molecular chaperone DnaK (HSP70)
VEEAIFSEVNGKVVGIDFGTTNSVLSYYSNGKIDQALFDRKKIVPTAIFFDSEKKLFFGKKALQRGEFRGENLLRNFKRDIGTSTKYTFSFGEERESETRNFVIDTNIFIDEPHILKEFGESDSVRLPSKVVDELHNLEKQSGTDIGAEMAIESITEERENLFFEESQLELLPEDLEQDSKSSENDNRILSIAKAFSNIGETYLLTNDKGLKLKAEDIVGGIKVLSLDEFRTLKASEEKTTSLTITPKDASRLFLEYLKSESEKYLNEYVDRAVITVPANFNQVQISQIKEAGEEAGFSEVHIQKEPVAAGLSYAVDETGDKRILVFDFGGGTLDCSILEIQDGEIEVVGTNGDAKLGGRDITEKMAEIIYEKIEEMHGIDMFDEADSGLSKNDFLSNRKVIYDVAENGKIELSEGQTTEISIPQFVAPDGNIDIEFPVTRKEFEGEITEIRKDALDVVKDLLNGLGFEAKDIDEIVLAGGSSNIPSIRDSLVATLGKTPSFTRDTSTVISNGAIIEAIRKWCVDCIEEKKRSFEFAMKDFGVAVRGHQFFELISEGTSLPVSFSKEFQTERDNQESINIEIFNRNSKVFGKANKVFDKGVDFIDTIQFSGIPQAPVGELTVKVDFELGQDDTLLVEANVFKRDGTEVDAKNLKVKGNSDV